MSNFTTALLFLAIFAIHRGELYAQANDSTSETRWYIPDVLTVQYAGNIGFISAGVGYASRTRNYEFGLLYGYVPKSMAGTYIHTITGKNTFPVTRCQLKNNKLLIPYVGLGVSLEVGGNAFFRMPDHFPDSYYHYPKNMRVLAYGGAKVQHFFSENFHGLSGVELFAEAGTLDLYVWYTAMSNEIKLHEIFSLAIGVNFLFGE
jgi:hypothetical protein